MTYRYCIECEQWYETFEIELDESGETVCPVDEHGYVQFSIVPGPRGMEMTEAELDDLWNGLHRRLSADDAECAFESARKRGLIP